MKIKIQSMRDFFMKSKEKKGLKPIYFLKALEIKIPQEMKGSRI